MLWHRDLSLLNRVIEHVEDEYMPSQYKWDFVPHPKRHADVISFLDGLDTAINAVAPYRRADYDSGGREVNSNTRDDLVLGVILDELASRHRDLSFSVADRRAIRRAIPRLGVESTEPHNERYGVYLSLDTARTRPVDDQYESVDPATLPTNPRFRDPAGGR